MVNTTLSEAVGVDVGAIGEQELDSGDVAVDDSLLQRRETVVLEYVNAYAMSFDEMTDDECVSLACGPEKGREAGRCA